VAPPARPDPEPAASGPARQFVHFFATTASHLPSRRADTYRCDCGGTDWGTAKAWWRERLSLIGGRLHLTLDSGRRVPTGSIDYEHRVRQP